MDAKRNQLLRLALRSSTKRTLPSMDRYRPSDTRSMILAGKGVFAVATNTKRTQGVSGKS